MTADRDVLAELQSVVDGTGDHDGHTREQIGRCVWCSCGARVQVNGRMAPPPPRRVRRWQVVLADGFVAYIGAEDKAAEIAGRHEGATVEGISG